MLSIDKIRPLGRNAAEYTAHAKQLTVRVMMCCGGHSMVQREDACTLCSVRPSSCCLRPLLASGGLVECPACQT